VIESCKNGFYITLTFVSLLRRTYIYVDIKSSEKAVVYYMTD